MTGTRRSILGSDCPTKYALSSMRVREKELREQLEDLSLKDED